MLLFYFVVKMENKGASNDQYGKIDITKRTGRFYKMKAIGYLSSDQRKAMMERGKKEQNNWFKCEKCGDVMEKLSNGKQSVCTKCGGMMKRL